MKIALILTNSKGVKKGVITIDSSYKDFETARAQYTSRMITVDRKPYMVTEVLSAIEETGWTISSKIGVERG